MGMTIHVIGIIPPDAKFKKMLAAHTACLLAGIEIPEELQKFFNYERPDENGVLIDIENDDCVKEYNSTSVSGFDIDVNKLPVGVKIIRVYNTW